MRASAVHRELQDLPYMSFDQGSFISDFIVANHLQQVLELGFYHGVSSAYIAGALHELGGGHLVTIDKLSARNLNPSIDQLLTCLGLERFVTWYFEETSYHWRLMKFLESGETERFDFCYIDGGHTWLSTGFAFFLVARLLRPGGWVLFDDLNWTQAKASPASMGDPPLPTEERETAQVGKVYDLLVRPDPAFGEFFVWENWGFARKRPQ